MAEHFETMHVLQHPTYMSKYPPGQGIVLAIGHWLGRPIFGAWICLALACAAISWAMTAVVARIWACTCSVLFAFSMNCVFYMLQIGYWAHSYWGGSVACLGSALAFGSVLWLGRGVDSTFDSLTADKSEGIVDSIGGISFRYESGTTTGANARRLMTLLTVFFIGLWLMAISRPLEGLLVSIPMSIAMLLLLRRHARSVPIFVTLKCLALPLLAGSIAMIWLAYYNARVTGSPFKLPYLCYEQQYALTPMFLEQPLRESPGFNNEPIRAFHADWEVGLFLEQQTRDGYLAKKQRDMLMLWEFFPGKSLSIPAVIGCLVSVVGLFRCRRSATSRLACMGGVAVGLIVLVHSHTPWMNPHYLAPLVPILWCWIGLGLASVSTWKLFRFEVGLFLAIACVGYAVLERYDEFDFNRKRLANVELWHHQRRAIEAQLRSTDGLHLVLLEYAPSHSPHEEWCYNAADIDRSKIVWARDLGQAKNDALIGYFSNRTVHRLAVGFGPLILEPVGNVDPSVSVAH